MTKPLRIVVTPGGQMRITGIAPNSTGRIVHIVGACVVCSRPYEINARGKWRGDEPAVCVDGDHCRSAPAMLINDASVPAANRFSL